MADLSDTMKEKKAWCPTGDGASDAAGALPAPGREEGLAAGPVERRARLFLYLGWAVVGIALLCSVVSLPYLPSRMAVHWNLYGNADGYAPAVWGAFGFPLIMIGLMVVLTVVPRFEQMKGAFSMYRDIYQILVFCMAVFMLAIHVITLLWGMGIRVPILVLMPVMFGLLFVVLGSLLPGIRRNTTMGFRFPWTMRDAEVWRRTHEYGSKVFMAAGVLTILSACTGIYAIAFMLAIILGATVYITVWSYRLSKEIEAARSAVTLH